MKRFPLVLVAALLGTSLGAQSPAPPPSTPTVVPLPTLRSAEELEQLLAPIALYPDALIALILPAATAPTDIVLAARQLRETPADRSQVEHRAWDESVKSLTSYVEVLRWLDENLQWTRQVGEAFAQQPADVMQAVQRLRARARAAGTLVDTPQQQVITETEVIRIVPAQPDVIYVPYYAPEIVFVDSPAYHPLSRPYLTFGLGVAVGSWLAYDCDWRRHTIWVGNRHRPWSGHDWRRPLVSFATLPPVQLHRSSSPVRPWRPPFSLRAGPGASQHPPSAIVRPAPPGISAMNTARPAAAAFTAPGRRPVAPPAAGPSAPAFTPPPRLDRSGARPPADFVRPAVPPLDARRPAVAMPHLQSLPGVRQAGPRADPAPVADQTVPRGSVPRGGRDARSGPPAARLPSAPPLPMATPDRNAPVMGPVAPRAQARSQPPPTSPTTTTSEAVVSFPRPSSRSSAGDGRSQRSTAGRSEGWSRSR
jgi:hypothetical protein